MGILMGTQWEQEKKILHPSLKTRKKKKNAEFFHWLHGFQHGLLSPIINPCIKLNVELEYCCRGGSRVSVFS
jgi:hypothetical protein